MNQLDRNQIIYRAATLAKGTRLDHLYGICDSNKSMRTSALRKQLDKLSEFMKQDAILLRSIVDGELIEKGREQ